jgi:hypothetical protein
MPAVVVAYDHAATQQAWLLELQQEIHVFDSLKPAVLMLQLIKMLTNMMSVHSPLA